uniref:Uncharacterized protein n=1 Tax=Spongospora subterranea TaxID=70186 RepID=A0A0H5RU17_9EUKA|eukprot:CRZ12229.1 hypothetical protein [Spongospora subterranea]
MFLTFSTAIIGHRDNSDFQIVPVQYNFVVDFLFIDLFGLIHHRQGFPPRVGPHYSHLRQHCHDLLRPNDYFHYVPAHQRPQQCSWCRVLAEHAIPLLKMSHKNTYSAVSLLPSSFYFNT